MGARDDVEGWSLMVPAAYDVLWTATVLLLVALTVGALLVWARRRESASNALVHLALILVVPVLGPAAYLAGAALDRRAANRAAARTPRPGRG
ncbi:PLDc N-terminal domain-containing protein [Cellulomonas sp. PS-H5]|uniref:PLDc N-terminal domain-containing protein n=1 Tax=Cellulomonas sp. PS-H5 TaxID=2820400 RepID=UPI001C4EC020|nr:PLDc N-terminal domain-containing protein [Cellulomonas sp. PS-H5]MBW0254650.1 PLDc N-terminal domain-containing protein [Cellulomonas sp. PS-H5]